MLGHKTSFNKLKMKIILNIFPQPQWYEIRNYKEKKMKKIYINEIYSDTGLPQGTRKISI